MDDKAKTIVIVMFGVGVIAYTIGYRNATRAMARNWSKNVAPNFIEYLAAQDAVNKIINPEKDTPPE
jgi:hypothetical protein